MTKEEKRKARLRVVDGKTIKRPSKVAFVIVSALLLVCIVVNAVLFSLKPYFGLVDNVAFKQPPSGKEYDEIEAKAMDITMQEASEGIVLLKNQDNALPLDGENKINVFGRGGLYSTFGGTGSGAGGTNYTSLYDGLAEAGFELNEDLVSFYKENAVQSKDMGIVGTDFGLYENSADELEGLIDGAKEYSDVALYVVSRTGGEAGDLPKDMSDYYGGESGKHYLELNTAEKSMLEMIEQNFGTVIVVINSTNTMELGFLDDERVDAALSCGCFGSVGTVALGNILNGTTNPSGKTVDTFAYEMESNPTFYSHGGYDYTNVSYENTAGAAGTGDAITGQDPYHYVKYNEGIYVGYRYYETAGADGFIDYDSTVQYPFGYGLSYTSFEETLDSVDFDGKTITAKIYVKNTGDVAGKDVVEIYYSAPYTPGGIEKSEVVLGGFTKTDELKPGQSTQVEVSFNVDDMSSYDYTGVKAKGGAYVLEAGDYDIRLQSDSHNVIAQETITIDSDKIYNDSADGKRDSDLVAATNHFDDVSYGEDINYLSRADWEGTMPKEQFPTTEEASDEIVAALTDKSVNIEDKSKADWTTKDNGLTLADMKGVDYDDSKWDDLLDEISKEDMEMLLESGGWQTSAIENIGKACYLEVDGPNGINNLMAKGFEGIKGNMYTNQAMLAATWNTDLAYQKGLVYGEEAKSFDVAGIYGPAVNIHRSPFSGRNYEYYSEDGFLSGIMAGNEMLGIKETGTYCYLKHFACNDQETNRDHGGVLTWLNEQALREVYLRGFEVAVKLGGATGIMSSYNRLGTTPTAESSALLNTVLRDEWGFKGAVVTDCVMACTTEDINRAVLAGNDLQLSFGLIASLSDELMDSVSGQQAMRQATKNLLYMMANSDAPELYDIEMFTIEKILWAEFIIFMVIFATYYIRRYLKLKKWKSGEPLA
ncbi:MAG: glycoside hydrolase family 3 C-terminal domain-containing protein [Pseudobutyrivibrio sp.]|nr:glycoside hydrolase family 3 C-terminal domain-containing protein [Pseudobutyrivibrio sp.]